MAEAGQQLHKLIGCTFVDAIETDGKAWVFRFSDSSWLSIECPWRIAGPDGVALGDIDHNQLFGRQVPVDGHQELNRLIANCLIADVKVDHTTADLTIEFSNGLRMELFSQSRGYESWCFGTPEGPTVVCIGGGQIASPGRVIRGP